MRRVSIAALAFGCVQLSATAAGLPPAQLVHPFPPAGPAEVVGTGTADKVLRTMQRYAVPAFTDVLAMHVAHALQGASDEPVMLTRKVRGSGREAVVLVSLAPADGRTLLLTISREAVVASPMTRTGVA